MVICTYGGKGKDYNEVRKWLICFIFKIVFKRSRVKRYVLKIWVVGAFIIIFIIVFFVFFVYLKYFMIKYLKIGGKWLLLGLWIKMNFFVNFDFIN